MAHPANAVVPLSLLAHPVRAVRLSFRRSAARPVEAADFPASYAAYLFPPGGKEVAAMHA
jgi:hypothetical protein